MISNKLLILIFDFYCSPTGKNHATRLLLSHLGLLSPENLQVRSRDNIAVKKAPIDFLAK